MPIPTINLDFDPSVFTLVYEKAGEGVIKVDVDLAEMMQISPERINELLSGTPARWLWWASVSEQLQQNLRAAKNSRDARLSEVSLQLRDQWNEALLGKRTESAVVERAKADPLYCQYVAEIEQAEFFAQLTLRIKDGLFMLNGNLISINANLRNSGDSSLLGPPAPTIRTQASTGVQTPSTPAPRPAEAPSAPTPIPSRRIIRRPPANQ